MGDIAFVLRYAAVPGAGPPCLDMGRALARDVANQIVGLRAGRPASIGCCVDRDSRDEDVARLSSPAASSVFDGEGLAGPPVGEDVVDALPLLPARGRAYLAPGRPAVEELRASLASGFPGIETSSHGWPSLVIR